MPIMLSDYYCRCITTVYPFLPRTAWGLIELIIGVYRIINCKSILQLIARSIMSCEATYFCTKAEENNSSSDRTHGYD